MEDKTHIHYHLSRDLSRKTTARRPSSTLAAPVNMLFFLPLRMESVGLWGSTSACKAFPVVPGVPAA